MSEQQLESLRAFAARERGHLLEHCPPIPVVSDWFLEVDRNGRITGQVISGACTSHVQYDPRFRAVFECGCEFYDNGLHEWLHTVEEFWRVSLRQQQRHRRLGELLQAAEDCTPETHQRVWAEVWRCLGWNVDTAREQYLERRAKQ
jgi:hypothetical protein